MNRLALLGAVACVMFASTASAAFVYSDPDPVTAPNTVANLIVNTIDASGITGDPSRTAVGEVILDGANNGQKFVGFNPGPLTIPTSLHGMPYTLSVDYFIPTGTGMDSLPDGSSPDLFWLQGDFNESNVGQSAGFIGGAAAGGGWQTLTLSGTVPAATGPIPVTSVTPLFVMADGGFGAGTPNGDGVTPALYVDNFVLNIAPEPASLMLVLLGAFGLVARRRR